MKNNNSTDFNSKLRWIKNDIGKLLANGQEYLLDDLYLDNNYGLSSKIVKQVIINETKINIGNEEYNMLTFKQKEIIKLNLALCATYKANKSESVDNLTLALLDTLDSCKVSLVVNVKRVQGTQIIAMILQNKASYGGK